MKLVWVKTAKNHRFSTTTSLYLQNSICINIETVSGPCNTCFWYARAPAVRNTSRGGLHGPETVSIFIANVRAIFNDILRKISTIFYAKTWDSLYCRRSLDVVRHWQWASLRAFLNLVRSMRSTTFNAFTFWVIFCHITLERSWVISFFIFSLNVRCHGCHPKRTESFISASANWSIVTRLFFWRLISEQHQWLTLIICERLKTN